MSDTRTTEELRHDIELGIGVTDCEIATEPAYAALDTLISRLEALEAEHEAVRDFIRYHGILLNEHVSWPHKSQKRADIYTLNDRVERLLREGGD